MEHTSKNMERPKSMSMVQEDQSDRMFQSSITTISTAATKATYEPKGRSINFTFEENNHENNLPSNHSTFDKFGDLSNVNMDEDDIDEVKFAKILKSKHTDHENSTLGKYNTYAAVALKQICFQKDVKKVA